MSKCSLSAYKGSRIFESYEQLLDEEMAVDKMAVDEISWSMKRPGRRNTMVDEIPWSTKRPGRRNTMFEKAVVDQMAVIKMAWSTTRRSTKWLSSK